MRFYEQEFDEYTDQDKPTSDEESIQQLNKAFDILSMLEQLLLQAPLVGCRRKVFRYILRAKRVHKDVSERKDLQDKLPVIAKLYVKLTSALVNEVRKCLRKKQ